MSQSNTNNDPQGVPDPRQDVILQCDACMITRVNLGLIPLAGYAEHERYAVVRPNAEAKGWKIRKVRNIWQVVCPACLAEETKRQAACNHVNRLCLDCGKMWDEHTRKKETWVSRIRKAITLRRYGNEQTG